MIARKLRRNRVFHGILMCPDGFESWRFLTSPSTVSKFLDLPGPNFWEIFAVCRSNRTVTEVFYRKPRFRSKLYFSKNATHSRQSGKIIIPLFWCAQLRFSAFVIFCVVSCNMRYSPWRQVASTCHGVHADSTKLVENRRGGVCNDRTAVSCVMSVASNLSIYTKTISFSSHSLTHCRISQKQSLPTSCHRHRHCHHHLHHKHLDRSQLTWPHHAHQFTVDRLLLRLLPCRPAIISHPRRQRRVETRASNPKWPFRPYSVYLLRWIP